jgi:hypothetical protein
MLSPLAFIRPPLCRLVPQCLVLLLLFGFSSGGFISEFGVRVCSAQSNTQANRPSAAQAQDANGTAPPMTPVGSYDPAIFQKPMQPGQLAFLKADAGAQSGFVMGDKQFRKLLKSFVPDCTFHYGSDMSLQDALDKVLDGSHDPALLRDGRYFMISGALGPYLAGRGFLWIDLQEGIGLGGFYFHPTNGEPTPTVAIFSRQVKQKELAISSLPPAFVEDMTQWSAQERIAPITTTYFLSGSNKRLLLEHDEDYCSPGAAVATPAAGDCQQADEKAADLDVTAADYLDQTSYATNATAWMISPQQVAWIGLRNNTCGSVINPMGCRIQMTHERTQVILHHGGGGAPRPSPHPHK